MKILLIRHGQTHWNSEGRVQGRTDVELNDRGEAQAQAAAEWLSMRRIDAVYASPLKRAYNTAEAIAKKHGLEPKKLDGLIEIDFGLWEGKTSTELAREFPEFWNDWSWHLDEGKSTMMKAESAYAILERAENAMRIAIGENASDSTIAIVSHTMPIKLLVANSAGIPLENLRWVKVDNCGICEIEIMKDGKRRLITWNEKGFLMNRGLI